MEKNIKIDEETWKELAKQKIDKGYLKIADVVKDNLETSKKFNNIEKIKEKYKKKRFVE